MAQFATVDDLNAMLGTSYESTDANIIRKLEMASGMVQTEARQRLEYVEDDVVLIPVIDPRRLYLPERPVIDVSIVEVQSIGTAAYVLGPTSYTARRWGRLYVHTSGSLDQWPVEWPIETALEVTYSHGYQSIPDDVMEVTCNIVGRMLFNELPTYRPGSPAPAEDQSGRELFSAEDRARIRSKYRPKFTSVQVERV